MVVLKIFCEELYMVNPVLFDPIRIALIAKSNCGLNFPNKLKSELVWPCKLFWPKGEVYKSYYKRMLHKVIEKCMLH